jgi:hypothetical protein
MTQAELLVFCQVNDLPVEAIDAVYNGGTWDAWDEPLDRELAHQIPSWCDDCEKYHRGFVARGLRIEDGGLWVSEYYAEDDDSLECCDDFEVETQEEFSREWLYWVENQGWFQNKWKEYWEHVVETGQDDIEEVWYLRQNDGESYEDALKRKARHELEGLTKLFHI